ncbi:MAG TPA: cupin-like domain-containing protein [Nannocystaceae bacterium]|nr:cupin-like domain-containing protein [Nannocystaceae bacterium]
MGPHEIDGAPSPEQFWSEAFVAQLPVIWRGALADHPLVELGRRGPEAFLGELAARAGRNPVTVTSAMPASSGRMGYGEGRWADWASRETNFATFASDVIHELKADTGHTLYLQSATVRECLPELAPITKLWLTDESRMLDLRTQLWIGSGGQRIPVHRDESHSIAAMAAGAKDFLLFPPEQLHNLHTTARRMQADGDPMRSAADPRNPDYQRYPRFADAMKTMYVAHLEPGDVMFLPAHWWHAVDSFGFNAMFNARWFDMPVEQRGDLTACFAQAFVTARTVAPTQVQRLRTRLHDEVFADEGAAARRPETRARFHEQLRGAIAITRRERPSPLRGPDVPLRTNPKLTVTIAGDAIELRHGHVRHFLDWEYLPLLRAFTAPTSPRAALAELAKSFEFEPDEAIMRVRCMVEDGILVADPGPHPPESAESEHARVDIAVAHVALLLATMPAHHMRAFEDTLDTFAFSTHGAPYPHLQPGEQGMLGAPLPPEAVAIYFERARKNLAERVPDALVAEDFWSRRFRVAPGQSCTIASDGLASEDKGAGTRHTLAWGHLEVLAQFRSPRTPSEALVALRDDIAIAETRLRELVISMIAAGILVPIAGTSPHPTPTH